MPPKKGKKGKGKGKGGPEDEMALKFLKKLKVSYVKICEEHGVAPKTSIVKKIDLEMTENDGLGRTLTKLLVPPNEFIPSEDQEAEPSLGADGAKCLAMALKEYNKVRDLTFWREEIGDEGFIGLSELIRSPAPRKLFNLELCDNRISWEGCKGISETLQTNRSLVTFNIEHNNIGDKGAYYLSRSFKAHPQLTTLILDFCNIGVEGCQAIAENLLDAKELSKLTTLSMQGNLAVGAEGVCIMAKAIEDNPIIAKVNWADCGFGDEQEAVLAIQQMATINNSLVEIDIRYNMIGEDAAVLYTEILKEKQSIKYFWVTERLGRETFKDLTETAMTNASKKKKKGGKKKK